MTYFLKKFQMTGLGGSVTTLSQRGQQAQADGPVSQHQTTQSQKTRQQEQSVRPKQQQQSLKTREQLKDQKASLQSTIESSNAKNPEKSRTRKKRTKAEEEEEIQKRKFQFFKESVAKALRR